ncbi:MAG TPA: polysaccharide deacetylase family protein [Vicinamibacterales bacterium]|jgi:peptidoglycan/xylan/chitin deacetylase (PgdA/CDA1 family)
MLKTLKLSALEVAARSGLSAAVRDSRWRQRRLLILCYHGLSLSDEHVWDPELYMEPHLLRRRFETLRRQQCAVLPLDEAVERLAHDDLPPRAVTITFDDGSYDFYKCGLPMLQEFGFPATVYLSTYYATFNRPVFDSMSRYLLWKANGRVLDYPRVLRKVVRLDQSGQREADLAIKEHARNMSGREKDELLAELAACLHIDYEALCSRRVLHLMTMHEAAECAAAGIDIELHTHRHRSPANLQFFNREIEDNRRLIEPIRQAPARHFCYPSGFERPEFPDWLERAGIQSATTCQLGMATRRSHPLRLPRLVDGSLLTTTEFDAWVSGVASFLPRRRLLVQTGVWPDEATQS